LNFLGEQMWTNVFGEPYNGRCPAGAALCRVQLDKHQGLRGNMNADFNRKKN
jgi:hypothetical protein